MRNEHGQALVEYAVIMPLFLFVMIGIVQLSLIISAKSTLKYAAFCAARAALNAEFLEIENAVITYPEGVDYGGDVQKGEATEAALLVLGAIPTSHTSGGVGGGDIILPGWGALKNTSALRDRLRVELYDKDNPDPNNPAELINLLASVAGADKDMYTPITAKLEYDMELLFPNVSLFIIGAVDGNLFGDDNSITLKDSCTLVRAGVLK